MGSEYFDGTFLVRIESRKSLQAALRQIEQLPGKHYDNRYINKVEMNTLASILEGVWNGLVVSGVITVCAVLARSVSALFLA